MTDADLRGRVLEYLYEVRHSGKQITLRDVEKALPDAGTVRLSNVCEQLNDKGLIHWKVHRALSGPDAGVGRIAAHGVDRSKRTCSRRLRSHFTTAESQCQGQA